VLKKICEKLGFGLLDVGSLSTSNHYYADSGEADRCSGLMPISIPG
jgi:hypothetical protein